MVSRLTPAYSAPSATVNQVFMSSAVPRSGRFRVVGDVALVPNGVCQRVGDVMRGWRPGLHRSAWSEYSERVGTMLSDRRVPPETFERLGLNREPIDVAAG